MKDNRLGGIALIIGAVCGVITMILHPVGGGHALTPAQFEKLAALIEGVHILAIVGIPFLFLGALALTRHLDSTGRLALTALVIYGLGLVAVLIAPALSGLVGTDILRRITGNGPQTEQWRLLMDYNHMVNQAFSRIYVVASSAAIALWSLAIVKNKALSQAIGFFGLALGLGIVIALASGLPMNAHGFGMIVFGEAIWLIVIGILLLRAPEPESRAPGGMPPTLGSAWRRPV